MASTVVIQSHAPGAPGIIRQATESVRAWAAANGFEYQFKHDELFDLVPAAVTAAAGQRRQMAADVARLAWIQALLDTGAEKVIWLDADVYIFLPDRMAVETPAGYAFGREFWMQPDKDGRLTCFANVHNAMLIFTPDGRATLDFYRQQAERILLKAGPAVPPQLVGPKLLTALHNVVDFPLNLCVGMASPLVIRDLADNGGPAWEMLCSRHGDQLAALNLSTSLLNTTTDGVELTAGVLEAAMRNLKT